jgi:hypothetical protein
MKNFKISENISFESIDNIIYVLNIDDGEYYELSETASVVWKEIFKGSEMSKIKEELKALFVYDKKMDSDIENLISELINLGLVIDC